MNKPAPLPAVVLISGSGTNLQSLIDTADDTGLDIRAVFSDRAAARGLERARQAEIPAFFLDPQRYASREAFDDALAEAIGRQAPALLILAGYMRILSPAFVRLFGNRTLNIHPSLLPQYRGLNTHRRVLAAGDAIHGCSVHFVTDELDGGPLVAQALVDVRPDDDETTLSARVQVREHRLYPVVAGWFAAGRLRCEGGQAWLDGAALQAPVVFDQQEEIE